MDQQHPFILPTGSIKEVLCLRTGRYLPIQEYIPSQYKDLVELRMAIKIAQKLNKPLVKCSYCNTPVYLIESYNHDQQFFFRHEDEYGTCPFITRGRYNQKTINAIKYNGAKESAPHIEMKLSLVKSLMKDKRFTKVKCEKRYKGRDSSWRKPDIQCVYNKLPIAFEIQLSTTFLDVIAERRVFYQQNGVLLFWIFKKFDSLSTRLTEDDIFYNNNCNAFVIDNKTTQLSKEKHRLHLRCIWLVPHYLSGEIQHEERCKIITIDDITFDPNNQQAYYFNYSSSYQSISQQINSDETLKLLKDITEILSDTKLTSSKCIEKINNSFRKYNVYYQVSIPIDQYKIITALSCILSAKEGRVIGYNFQNLTQIFHNTYNSHKTILLFYIAATRVYDSFQSLFSHGKSYKLNDCLCYLSESLTSNNSIFLPDVTLESTLQSIFPDVIKELHILLKSPNLIAPKQQSPR